MGRTLAVLASAALLVALPAAPAGAAETSVAGTGDISTMTVRNGPSAVTAKLNAPGGSCDIRYVAVKIRGITGVTYTASTTCSEGTRVRALTRAGETVSCEGLRIFYKAKYANWRFEVPRDCMPGLGYRVKASSELICKPTTGAAGPTRWLARG